MLRTVTVTGFSYHNVQHCSMFESTKLERKASTKKIYLGCTMIHAKTVFFDFRWKIEFAAKIGGWVVQDPSVYMTQIMGKINIWEISRILVIDSCFILSPVNLFRRNVIYQFFYSCLILKYVILFFISLCTGILPMTLLLLTSQFLLARKPSTTFHI